MTTQKTYPKGTTAEQWQRYEIDKAKHDDFCLGQKNNFIRYFNDEPG